MLTLAHWTVRRGGAVVVDGVDLEVRPGEVVGLAGPSGGGKSTLVLSLLGRVTEVRGALSWKGHPTTPAALMRDVGCAAVVAGPLGGQDLSVQQWLTYHGVARGAAPGRVDQVLRETGLAAHAQTLVGQLSSGLCERLLLARATLRPPGVVFIDHPLGHLDAAGEYALAAWLDRLRGDRAAILWVSADRGRLEAHCDRIAVLTGGCLGSEVAASGWADTVARTKGLR